MKEIRSLRSKLDQRRVGEKRLKTKLDQVWSRQQEERELVMLVTKTEVEKAKDH